MLLPILTFVSTLAILGLLTLTDTVDAEKMFSRRER